jgi:hypothetical protein
MTLRMNIKIVHHIYRRIVRKWTELTESESPMRTVQFWKIYIRSFETEKIIICHDDKIIFTLSYTSIIQYMYDVHGEVFYTSTWTGFELKTLVVIGTDCIGSCTFDYHRIMTTMTPRTKKPGVALGAREE